MRTSQSSGLRDDQISCLSIVFVENTGELLDGSLTRRSICFSHNKTVSGMLFSFIVSLHSILEKFGANVQFLAFLPGKNSSRTRREATACVRRGIRSLSALRSRRFDHFRPTKLNEFVNVKSYVVQIINSTVLVTASCTI